MNKKHLSFPPSPTNLSRETDETSSGFSKTRNFSVFKRAKAALLLLMLGLCSFSAFATHYRYGNISWTRPNNSSRAVTFTVTMSFRKSFYATANLGATVNSGYSLEFGDGTSTPINLLVTSVNTTEDWFFGTFTTTRTYGGAGTVFTAGYSNCCRLSTLKNNNDGNFSSRTTINLTNGNLGSPVSTMPPIVNLSVGNASASFTIPGIDPDGTAITYSLASGNEVGVGTPGGSTGTYTQPAGLTVNATTGVVNFSTVGKNIGDLYTTAIVLTDQSGSKSIVDFIIRIVNVSNPPQYDYSVTPLNGHVYSINPGQSLHFNVKATDSDANDIVNLSVVGLASGMSFTPSLPANGNPVNTSFSWTPGTSQLGIYVLSFTAQDITGTQKLTTVIINVNVNPVFISPTPAEGSSRYAESGTAVNDDIAAENPDNSTVQTKITAATIPAGASLSATLPTSFANVANISMSWTPTAAHFGENNLSFTAEDENNHTVTRNYKIIANTTPVFTSSPLTSVVVGQNYVYNITVNDPDLSYGDHLEIVEEFVGALPAWLTLTDNGDGTATLSGTPSMADVGAYTIPIEAEDLYHHDHPEVKQEFQLEVIGLPPYIQCPANITVNADDRSCGAIITYSAGISGAPSPVVNYSHASGSLFPVGTTTVVITASNAVGADTCTFTVTVNDNQFPEITCAAAVNVNTDAGRCGAEVSLTAPGTSDNCGIASVSNDAPAFFAVGTTTVTWTATDVNGNSSTCTQTVTVTDHEAPSITCAAAVNVNNDAGRCGAEVSLTAPVTSDNCGIASVSNDAPAFFAVGTTTVTWTATDVNGNSSTCTQTVTVTDNEAPVANCKNITLVLVNGVGTVAATDIDNGSTDNCGIAAMSLSKTDFTCADEGNNTVTLTVTDVNGNTSTCTAVVSIGNVPTCSITAIPASNVYTGGVPTNIYLGYGPQSVKLLANGGSATGCTYSWSPAGNLSCTDCQEPEFTATTEGTVTYTVTITSSNGCAKSCEVSICVIDARDNRNNNNPKIFICHVPDGNPGNPQTISISVNAVPTHLGLHSGDRLGACNKSCGNSKMSIADVAPLNQDVHFTAQATPNPSSFGFTLTVSSASDANTEVRMTDMMGRTVLQLSNVTANSPLQVDENFPSGIYFIQVIQENNTSLIKWIKQD